MTVLVGYVPTPLGEATLRAGVEESRRRTEPLLVVNMSRDDVLVDAHRAGRADLDRVERDVTELGVDVEVVRVEQGTDPADALVRVAGERDASVIVIGGQKPRVSPMARQMTPRSINSCAARAPTLPGWAKPVFERCGASSRPPISPRCRASPTSGWPASRSR